MATSSSSSSSSTRKQLPIRIGEITKDNFNQLRKLNQVVFPVAYSAQFYDSIVRPEVSSVTKLAWHNDVVVGGICCRFQSASSSSTSSATNPDSAVASPSAYEQKSIYIMTVGVLAPYRGRGIGSKLLRQIVEYAESHSDIADVFLHVQVNNTEALEFYLKHGFENVGTIEGYYKKIDPPDCFIVRKSFVHVNMGGGSSSANALVLE